MKDGVLAKRRAETLAKRPAARTSILQAFVAAGGMRKAFRAATYLASWGPLYEQLGRVPTVEEYCEFWKQSRATTFRESQAFNECSPVDVEQVWLSMPAHVRSAARRAAEGSRDEVTAAVASARWAV